MFSTTEQAAESARPLIGITFCLQKGIFKNRGNKMAVSDESMRKVIKDDVTFLDYPEKYREAFQKAITTKILNLDLGFENLTTEADFINFIAPFLSAYPTVSHLIIRNNQVGDRGAQAIAKQATLNTLDISNNQLSEIGVKALAENKSLNHLNISLNPIRDIGAEILANCENISYLCVILCGISDKGGETLAESKTITTLILRGNQLGPNAAKALAANTKLTVLDVSTDNFLATLTTHSNLMGDLGAQALAASTSLTELYVAQNGIGDEGIKALANNKTIKVLDISGNKIGITGTQALASNGTLTTLYVDDKQINGGFFNKALTLLSSKFQSHVKQTLEGIPERRSKEHAEQKLAFLMGTHHQLGKNSPILHFYNSKICDKNSLTSKIFDYIKPIPFKLSIRE